MADKEEFDFEEIHFLPIPSQTNIYGLTKIDGNDEERKLFLASLSGRVVCLEYPRNSPVPTSKEVPFTYIPGLWKICAWWWKRALRSYQIITRPSLGYPKKNKNHAHLSTGIVYCLPITSITTSRNPSFIHLFICFVFLFSWSFFPFRFSRNCFYWCI